MKVPVNNLAKKIFGSSGSKIRRIWYWLIIPAALAFVMSFREGGIVDFLIYYISIYVVLFLLFLGYFFTDIPGVKIIKSWIYLRRLKKNLDPVALAISAKISSKCDFESGNFYHYYEFPDGNFITLMVWEDGFNVFLPNWNPGYEKKTEGLEILKRTIEKARVSG
jgi:hypothetical protein